MIDWFVSTLREYPAIALFLTIGLGFLLAKVKIGSFSLGNVTSVLLVAVAVGQLKIPMSGPIKMFFFMMFLFSVGYSVGPDFFKSLRGQGARQALFAVIMSVMCFASVFLMAKLMGYTKGEAVGMFAGSETCSSVIGVGSEALARITTDAAELKKQTDIIPVCYAVTYIFGTLGTVIILGTLGPKLLGGLDKVKAATSELEKQLASGDTDSDNDKCARIDAGEASDLMFVGLTVFVGALFGALSVWVGSIPLSLGTSGGALVGGIVFGWWRSKKKRFGYIPKSALWVMNNLGLNVFIAVIGIEAAPEFVSGIREIGPMLFVAGAVCTTLPLLGGLWMGHKIFKFNPAITLGCCAGTRTCTASLGAVQDAIDSTLPAMAYSVTYAVANILLVVWGLLTTVLI